MASRLDELLRAQQSFAADAAHELRTPVQALRLRLENLEDEVAPRGRRDLEAAHAEALRLARLVTGLLELARAEDAAQPDVAIELAPAVRSRIGRWREPQPPAGVPLDVSGAAGTCAYAQRRSGRAGARQPARERGRGLAARGRDRGDGARAGAQVELRVSDEGPGLSPEDKARAFDRFWRGRDTGDGSGLGLAIVRRLVERDGGSVELRCARRRVSR